MMMVYIRECERSYGLYWHRLIMQRDLGSGETFVVLLHDEFGPLCVWELDAAWRIVRRIALEAAERVPPTDLTAAEYLLACSVPVYMHTDVWRTPYRYIQLGEWSIARLYQRPGTRDDEWAVEVLVWGSIVATGRVIRTEQECSVVWGQNSCDESALMMIGERIAAALDEATEDEELGLALAAIDQVRKGGEGGERNRA